MHIALLFSALHACSTFPKMPPTVAAPALTLCTSMAPVLIPSTTMMPAHTPWSVSVPALTPWTNNGRFGCPPQVQSQEPSVLNACYLLISGQTTCRWRSSYVGSTDNLGRQLYENNRGHGANATADPRLRSWEIVVVATGFCDRREAFRCKYSICYELASITILALAHALLVETAWYYFELAHGLGMRTSESVK